jgi:hypothetical protein
MNGALLILALAAAATPGDSVVIRAGDVTISASGVAARAAELRSSGARLSPEQIVDGLATEAALTLEARRTGVAKKPDTVAALEYERARAMADAFTASLIAPSASFPEAEIKAQYHQGSDLARLSVVVVETQAEAQAVKGRLASGGDFAVEAARSLDPRSSGNRGDTGLIPRAQIDPALANEAFRAPIGSLVGPVLLRSGGWGVARVVERTIADEAGLPQARDRITAYIRKQATAQARSHTLEMLKRSVKISVDERFLASLGARIEPTGKDADTVVATVGERSIRYRELLPGMREVASVGHGNVTLKRQVVDAFVENLLLATEAHRRNLDDTAAARATLARVEMQTLARMMARSLLADQPPSTTPERLNGLLAQRGESIRKRADVWIDRPAALAAAAGAR